MDRSEVRVIGGDSISQLVQAGLAKRDGAGITQLGDDHGIPLGKIAREDFRAGRGADALDSHQVFVGDRDAMQQAAVKAACQLAVALGRLGQRSLAGHGDESV